jgi:hypothetical protein
MTRPQSDRILPEGGVSVELRRGPFGPEISWPSGYSDLEYGDGDYRYRDPAQSATGPTSQGEHPYDDILSRAYGGDTYRDLGHDLPSAPVTFDVTIYLAEEAIHEEVETAVENWLAIAGLAIEEWGEPVIRSWFRPLKAAAKQAARSGAARDAALTAVHAADARLVLAQDAQITAVLLQNLAPVLASLQSTKDAVIRAGALLIVKVDWQVKVFQLTAAQQAKLDHRPQLASSPHDIVQAIQLAQAAPESDALPAAE